MFDSDDRRSEWTPQPYPTEEPRLVEYDWAHERKHEKQVPIAIIEAVLAELGLDEDEDELPGVH